MRGVLVVVLVLLVLAVGADRLAWKLAEGEVATRIQSSENLQQKPDVAISGFPFLTQVFRGDYQGVSADLQDLPVDQGVTVDQVKVKLAGMKVPFKNLAHRDLNSIPVDSASITGDVSYATLNTVTATQLAARTAAEGLTIQFARPSSGAADQIGVTGDFAPVLGTIKLATVKLSGDAQVTVQGRKLVVTVVPGTLNVPALVRDQLTRLLSFSYQLPGLPFGLQISKLASGPSGVAITASGKNLVIGSSGLA